MKTEKEIKDKIIQLNKKQSNFSFRVNKADHLTERDKLNTIKFYKDRTKEEITTLKWVLNIQ